MVRLKVQNRIDGQRDTSLTSVVRSSDPEPAHRGFFTGLRRSAPFTLAVVAALAIPATPSFAKAAKAKTQAVTPPMALTITDQSYSGFTPSVKVNMAAPAMAFSANPSMSQFIYTISYQKQGSSQSNLIMSAVTPSNPFSTSLSYGDSVFGLHMKPGNKDTVTVQVSIQTFGQGPGSTILAPVTTSVGSTSATVTDPMPGKLDLAKKAGLKKHHAASSSHKADLRK